MAKTRPYKNLIFSPRLDFGYASKPENSASAACSNFQGITVATGIKEKCFEVLKSVKKLNRLLLLIK
jgi:hypothetical protein